MPGTWVPPVSAGYSILGITSRAPLPLSQRKVTVSLDFKTASLGTEDLEGRWVEVEG